MQSFLRVFVLYCSTCGTQQLMITYYGYLHVCLLILQ